MPLSSFPVDAAKMPSGVGVSGSEHEKLNLSFDMGGMGYGCLEGVCLVGESGRWKRVRKQLSISFKLLCLYLQETFLLNNSSAMIGLFFSFKCQRRTKSYGTLSWDFVLFHLPLRESPFFFFYKDQ